MYVILYHMILLVRFRSKSTGSSAELWDHKHCYAGVACTSQFTYAEACAKRVQETISTRSNSIENMLFSNKNVTTEPCSIAKVLSCHWSRGSNRSNTLFKAHVILVGRVILHLLRYIRHTFGCSDTRTWTHPYPDPAWWCHCSLVKLWGNHR